MTTNEYKAQLEDRQAGIEDEIRRRLKDLDTETIQDLVKRQVMWRRLLAVAENEGEDAELRLDAATRALDLMGITPRSAKLDTKLSELSLVELMRASDVVDYEISRCGRPWLDA